MSINLMSFPPIPSQFSAAFMRIVKNLHWTVIMEYREQAKATRRDNQQGVTGNPVHFIQLCNGHNLYNRNSFIVNIVGHNDAWPCFPLVPKLRFGNALTREAPASRAQIQRKRLNALFLYRKASAPAWECQKVILTPAVAMAQLAKISFWHSRTCRRMKRRLQWFFYQPTSGL